MAEPTAEPTKLKLNQAHDSIFKNNDGTVKAFFLLPPLNSLKLTTLEDTESFGAKINSHDIDLFYTEFEATLYEEGKQGSQSDVQYINNSPMKVVFHYEDKSGVHFRLDSIERFSFESQIEETLDWFYHTSAPSTNHNSLLQNNILTNENESENESKLDASKLGVIYSRHGTEALSGDNDNRDIGGLKEVILADLGSLGVDTDVANVIGKENFSLKDITADDRVDYRKGFIKTYLDRLNALTSFAKGLDTDYATDIAKRTHRADGTDGTDESIFNEKTHGEVSAAYPFIICQRLEAADPTAADPDENAHSLPQLFMFVRCFPVIYDTVRLSDSLYIYKYPEWIFTKGNLVDSIEPKLFWYNYEAQKKYWKFYKPKDPQNVEFGTLSFSDTDDRYSRIGNTNIINRHRTKRYRKNQTQP